MIGIIIAAGYATRLYPLTKDFPKPLLQVGYTTILDRLVDHLEKIESIDRIVLITNHKFITHFEEWKKTRTFKKECTLLDNGTTSKDDRLGAVGDMQFAIEKGNIDDDILVCASDNIITFQLQTYIDLFEKKHAPVIGVRTIADIEDRKQRGIVTFNEENVVTSFEEKPLEPKSEWGVPPFYLYPKETLPRIKQFLDAGENPDAPGHFVGWLYKQTPVYVLKIFGEVFDIGNPESLAVAQERFK